MPCKEIPQVAGQFVTPCDARNLCGAVKCMRADAARMHLLPAAAVT